MASTDFDIYDMDGGLTTIFDASTDVQDGAGGDDFPIEFIGGGAFSGERLLIDKFAAGTTSSVADVQPHPLPRRARRRPDDQRRHARPQRRRRRLQRRGDAGRGLLRRRHAGRAVPRPVHRRQRERELHLRRSAADHPQPHRRRDHAGQPHQHRRCRPPEARHHGRRRRLHRRARASTPSTAPRPPRRTRPPSPALLKSAAAGHHAGAGPHRPDQLGDRHRGGRSRP